MSEGSMIEADERQTDLLCAALNTASVLVQGSEHSASWRDTLDAAVEEYVAASFPGTTIRFPRRVAPQTRKRGES